jgi:cytochrome c oxidase subunit III
LSEVSAQFKDLAQQAEASRLGMWVFLVTEVLFFGGLFTGYTVYRSATPEAFAAASRHLDVVLGAVNTFVLITSSLTMALAVKSAESRQRNRTVMFLAATALLGSAFLGIKFWEYAHKAQEHLIPGPYFSYEHLRARETQLFFSFYFVMTGLHALHMMIGLGLLTVLAVAVCRGRWLAPFHAPVELTGLYWHFVDVVWIFLFPLLYLIGRHVP